MIKILFFVFVVIVIIALLLIIGTIGMLETHIQQLKDKQDVLYDEIAELHDRINNKDNL